MLIEMRTRNAFTLVEIAIVLVIIGLLTGAIFVGREMIIQSGYNKQIRQLTELDTATNAFRDKYLGYPGDITNATGYFANYTGGTVVNGNGNGRLMPLYAGSTEVADNYDYYLGTLSPESVQFYVHLVASGLYSGLQPDGDANILAGKDCPVGAASTVGKACMMPYWITSASSQPNTISGHYLSMIYYADNTPVNTQFNSASSVNMISMAAFFIDTKIDDGKPYTGQWVCPKVAGGSAGQRPPLGSWGYDSACSDGTTYRNLDLSGYTIPYGAQDPGMCYCFYKIKM